MDKKKPAGQKDKKRRLSNQPSNITPNEKLRHDSPADSSIISGAAAPAVKTEIPSPDEVNKNWRKPITNQDEQEKITNKDAEESTKDF